MEKTREQLAQEWQQAHVSDVGGSDGAPGIGGQRQATPDPAFIALPRDNVQGTYPAIDTDATYESGYLDVNPDELRGSQLVPAPVPMIGAIPFGGIVQSAAQVNLSTAAGSQPWIIIGDRGNGAPRVTEIMLYSTAAIGSFEIVADGQQDQPGNGAQIPVGTGLSPFVVNLRRVTVRATGVGPFLLHYVVLAHQVWR